MTNTSYLAIPYNILTSESLTLSAKILLAEILSLSKLEGFCYASNDYLAKRLGMSVATIKLSVQNLKKQGFVTSKTLNNERLIYPSQAKIYPAPGRKISLPPDKIYTEGRLNFSHNNNIYNNNYNNIYKENRNSFDDYMESDEASYDISELMKIKPMK